MKLFSLNIDKHICESLYQNSKYGIFSHIISIIILFFFFWNITKFNDWILWFSTLTIATLIKLLITFLFFKKKPKDQHINYWYSTFILSSFILSAVWSLTIINLFPDNHPVYQLIIIIIVTGLSMGSLLTLSIDKLAILSFSQPIILSTAVRLYLVDDDSYQTITFLLLVLDIPVIAAALHTSEILQHLHNLAAAERDMNLAKTTFLVNMSHEIRTPMNAVIGIGYLLEKTKLSTKQADYVEKLKQASETLLGIINSILDFSRIEAGRMELENTAFFLDTILKTVKAHVITQAQKKALNFTIDVAENIEQHLIGDPLRLTQILTNLSANAIKFTSRGSVTIQVRQLDKQDDKVTLLFKIIDTGPGIKKDDQKKLFDSFTQLNSSDSRKHGGTGLGLTISQRLLEMMGSTIEIFSIPGEGSTFFFTLKLDIAPAEKLEVKTKEAPASKLDIVNELVGKTILVVDDDELNQELVKEILSIMGLQVSIAGSAKEAFWLLSESLPDLILMDLQMPEMTGYEALDVLRDNPEWVDIPVIALTANARVIERNKALSYGMDDFLTKPINPHELKQKLLRWIPHDKHNTTAQAIPIEELTSIITIAENSATEVAEKLASLIDMLGSQSARKLFKQIKQTIDKESPILINLLQEKNFDQAAPLAHRLKGSLNLYGSSQLEELLSRINDHKISNNEINTICTEVKHEFKLILQKIEEYK